MASNGNGNTALKDQILADMAKELEKQGTTVKSEQEKIQESVLELLHQLGGGRTSDDDLIFEGRKFVIPETMDLQSARDYLKRRIEQDEEVTSFSKTFDYRPWDGAYCMNEAMKKGFGTSGIAAATMTMFGKQPPRLIEIAVGVGKTVQVPWGQIEFPILNGTIYTAATRDREKGLLFQMVIEAPRKHAARVQGLFALVQRELETNSIYRGKAFDGAQEPSFINPRAVDPSKIVYTDEVRAQFEANVWGMLRYTRTYQEMELPLKRSVLLAGPYGSGKSLGAMLTAQIALDNGWTFIQARPGVDDLSVVLQTAKLYQPAVVFFEDVDTIASTGDADQVTKLLDMFDGIQAKGTKLLAVMTTNHADKLHKGMMRPGRLDAVIEIAAMDMKAKRELIVATVPPAMLAGDVDYDAVDRAMEGFLPAFIKEAIDRAQRYAISRAGGRPSVLTTADFVEAALGLRPQWEAMQEAVEGYTEDTLQTALKSLLAEVVNATTFVDSDGDQTTSYEASALKVDPENAPKM